MATAKDKVEKYAYLWAQGAQGNWVLLKDKTGACLPYNLENRHVLLIEEDDLSFEVVDRMIKAGVRVFDQPPSERKR